MSYINWGLAGGGNNALASFGQGMQMGDYIRQRREQREERQRQEQGRNALATYAATGEGMDAAMQYDPRATMAIRGDIQAQQAQAANQRRADLPMLTRLLDHASQGEQQWNEAIGLAQQYGIDVSGLPQQFDPQWAKSQSQTMKLLATPEGQEALSTAGKQAVDMGYRPGTPEFQAKVTEIWQQNGAIPYTDANGATRLYIPGRNGVQTQQAITEGTVIENDAGEKMVLRNGKWEPMGGTAGNGGGTFQP